MPKPVPRRGPEPDPMAGIVDRLLAQLPGLQQQPEPSRPAGGLRTTPYFTSTITTSPAAGSQNQVLSVWLRVLLGLSLGIMMEWWPYSRACGLPLFGYLAAVSTVTVSGIWAASGTWRVRTGLGHTLALVLVFYGMLLGASELLPRTGYAVERATWTCDDKAAGPSLVLSSGF
jgi:hypothetical protein